MTNGLIFLVVVMLQTNRVESIHPGGQRMTAVEVVNRVTLLTNSVPVMTNVVDFELVEMKIPHPIKSKTIKVWKPSPKPSLRPALRAPRDRGER